MAATTKRFVAKNGLDNNANSITNLGASGASLTLSGANALTLTTTGSTNITLPTSGTLSTTGSKLSAFAATTSAELAGVISDETGSGALVFATSPTLTTPTLGVATATSINGTTIPSSKTLTVTTDNLSVFAATTSAQLAGVISDETGSGALVFANTPTLVTPVLGTPTSGTLTNCTGLPVSGITASTTTALGVGSIELGHATDTTLSRSASGVLAVEGIDVPTISSTSTLTNKSLSDSTTYFIDETDGTKKLQFQLSGITTATTRTLTAPDANGTIALTNNKLSAFAATTSSELAGVISDETGSGALVFANTPTLVTPTLGVASATSINKVAITAPATSATLTIADGKTLTASNTLTFTGTDASSVAFGTGGTVAYTANNLSVFAATTSAQLAGVISDETGSGSLVFSASPTFTGTVNAAAISTSGNVTVGGDLTVNGTTTTINSTTLAVDDKNVILGDVATPTDVTADGGGFTLKGTTDKTFNWVDATDAWTSSEHIALAAGKNLVLAGSTSGTVTMAVPAAAGTTTITFPGATGTLATLAGSETFTNKTLTSPTMTTPTLGVASATSINKVAITAPATSATLTIADGKTLTASNTLTFTGTDASSVAFGAGGTVAYTANKLSAFAATTSSELAGVISDETGSGALVFATSPTLVTPILGTPTSGTLTNCTGLPVSGISASTTTALGVGSIELGHATDTTLSRSSAGVLAVEGVAVPTISSTSTLTNKSLSDSTTYFIDEADNTKKMQFQLSGITTATTRTLTVPNADGTIALTGNNLSVFAATTSAQLAGVISDETGSGALVFATSPTLVTPILGTPTSGTLTNCTGLPVSGISASTTTALGVGSIELGHATDTTIARSSAGVITVEGVVVPTISSTSTLTNKSLSDSTTYFIDETDGTKKMQFQLSGITTATTRTLTVPNFDGTIATLAGTESLSNKTITVSSFSGTTGAFSGAVTMTANTASTTNSTGTLVITGGLGVSGAINAGGEITAYASSDERLKENVAVISNAMGKINAVRGVTFDWKDEIIESKGGEDGYFVRKKDVGVIAQEIEAVLPEIVATRDNGTKAVRYEKLVALLIEAVKELGSKVEQLEAKAAK